MIGKFGMLNACFAINLLIGKIVSLCCQSLKMDFFKVDQIYFDQIACHDQCDQIGRFFALRATF